MSKGRFTLDYLLDVIADLHRRKYIILSQYPNRTEIQRAMSGLFKLGIVEKSTSLAYKFTKLARSGSGRPHTVYTLAVPYESILLGDVYHLVENLSGIRLQLCRLGHDVPLSQLKKVVPLHTNLIKAYYSADVLVNGLARLSSASYKKHESIVGPDFPWHDKQWISDMTSINITKNKYGLGYRLTKPLTKLTISPLLPYLCYRSPRKQTYNKLFYLFRNKPFAILVSPDVTHHQLG